MIKRILVALDPDEDTQVATQYAAGLARRFGGTVSGLAVIDTKRIAHEVGPGGAIGAAYYAGLSRQRLTEDARLTAQRLIVDFERVLNEAHVPHGERVEEGVPMERVIDEMKVHDLLVIGSASHFFYSRPARETNTLPRIVKNGITPTLVVADAHRPVERVLVAYDASDPSARTLQRFAQLRPFGTDLAIELVHVRASDRTRDRTASDLLLRRAGTYLRDHGFAQVTETSRDGGAASDQLLEHIRLSRADLVVAGAHSVSAVRRIAFGSTMHTLLHEIPVPFFVYH